MGNVYRRETPVHPHGCGEHAQSMISLSGNRGSSPRVWGTFGRGAGVAVPQRFIPTGVGNIFDDAGFTGFFAVHPHGCGEHTISLYLQAKSIGSSPRVWGTCGVT